MKMNLGRAFLFFAMMAFTSCQTFPANYLSAWNTFTYKNVIADCNISDFRLVFPKCDAVFGNTTKPDFIKASINLLLSLFSSRNTDTIYTSLGLFCKAAYSYKNCMEDTNKLCKSKNSNWTKLYKFTKRDHPSYRVSMDFCKNGNVAPKYVAQKKKVDTKLCLQNTFARFNDSMTNYKTTIDRMKNVITRDPSQASDGKTDRALTVLCQISANLKRVIYIVGKSCNTETKSLLLKVTQFLFPPEIIKKCIIPKDDRKSSSLSYKTGQKNRITISIFGGFHKYGNKKATETCQYNSNENVTILELDKLRILCTVDVLKSNFTYIKSCSVIFYDDNRNVIDNLDYSSSGIMSKTFAINNGTTLGPQSKKGTGKSKSAISIRAINPTKMLIIDQNTGVSFVIFLFTSSQKINIYSLVIRLTQTAYDSAVGEVTRQCINNINLSSKRKKRSTLPDTSNEANYDAKNLNDTKAKTMAANALLETNNIVSTDTATKGTDRYLRFSNLIVILPFGLLLLF